MGVGANLGCHSNDPVRVWDLGYQLVVLWSGCWELWVLGLRIMGGSVASAPEPGSGRVLTWWYFSAGQKTSAMRTSVTTLRIPAAPGILSLRRCSRSTAALASARCASV